MLLGAVKQSCTFTTSQVWKGALWGHVNPSKPIQWLELWFSGNQKLLCEVGGYTAHPFWLSSTTSSERTFLSSRTCFSQILALIKVFSMYQTRCLQIFIFALIFSHDISWFFFLVLFLVIFFVLFLSVNGGLVCAGISPGVGPLDKL